MQRLKGCFFVDVSTRKTKKENVDFPQEYNLFKSKAKTKYHSKCSNQYNQRLKKNHTGKYQKTPVLRPQF